MSRRIKIRPAAEADYDIIWQYSAERWSTARADRYIEAIDAAVTRMAEDAVDQSRCDHIKPGYVRRRAGSHHVFAIVSDDTVIVVRILHEKMNFIDHLTEVQTL